MAVYEYNGDHMYKKELEFLKKDLSTCTFDESFCQIDFKPLLKPWVNQEFVEILNCLFAPFLPDLDITTTNPITFEFIETKEKLADRVFVVTCNGTKFILKEEEYAYEMEVLLHEYFVGYFINKFNNPLFAKVIGLFGCSADDCEFKGKSNFILYQYISGHTMFDALDKKIITSAEAFYLINLVYEGLKEMYKLTGFIHQDLHLSNIILQPLDDWYNININGLRFTIRYLPKIIDYGRAQILYNKHHQFSPKLIHMLPAKSLDYDLAYLISLYDVYNPDIFDELGIKSENNVHYLTNYVSSIITKLWMTLSDYYQGSFIPPVSVKWIEEEPFVLNLDYQKCLNKRDVPDNLINKYDERLHYLKMEREFNKAISKIMYSRNNIIYIIDLYFKYNFPLSKNRYEEILAIIYYSLNRRGARALSGGPDDNRIIEEYLLNYNDNYTPQISGKIKEFIENYQYS